MNLTTENILLVGSILLFVSLFVGKTSFKFGIPVLVLFLAIGILAGSEGIGGINFDDPKMAQFIGIIALNFILFSGGLDTDWQSVRPVLWQGISLSTLGVLITALTVGLFVWWITDFTLYEGLLLGSIVSSTDSAAVFSILRSRSLKLQGNLRPTLELESGSNDPMAYVLTIVFTAFVINQDSGFLGTIPVLFKQIAIGGALGFTFGKMGKFIINNIRLDYEGLYTVLMIAIMFFSFSATDFVGGNGFLAVYLCAIYLGNQDILHKKKFVKSFDSFAWLMQIILFLTLGLLVFPSHIIPFIGIGLMISLFLIVIARPVGVFLSLLFFKLEARQRWFISWVGLRGAVPIVFATYPLLAGAEKSHMIFNVVFFISLTSVIIQGSTLATVAKWLKLTVTEPEGKPASEAMILPDEVKEMIGRVMLTSNSKSIDRTIVELGLPKTTLIAIIERNNSYFAPSGSTVLKEGDQLTILSENKQDLQKACEKLDAEVKKGEGLR
ncbi:MAG: potassium/proton antiporter [Bacteroidales bacterium]